MKAKPAILLGALGLLMGSALSSLSASSVTGSAAIGTSAKLIFLRCRARKLCGPDHWHEAS